MSRIDDGQHDCRLAAHTFCPIALNDRAEGQLCVTAKSALTVVNTTSVGFGIIADHGLSAGTHSHRPVCYTLAAWRITALGLSLFSAAGGER